MNRRNFLKLLAPMPFAAPAIVTACGQPKITGGVFSLCIDGKMIDVLGDFSIERSLIDYEYDVDRLNKLKFDSVQIITKEGKKITFNDVKCEAGKIDGESDWIGIRFKLQDE